MSSASQFVEPLLWFTRRMAEKLSRPKNVGKIHWTDCDEEFLRDRLKEELAELELALNAATYAPEQIIEEASDVANFAMMIADRQRQTRGYT